MNFTRNLCNFTLSPGIPGNPGWPGIPGSPFLPLRGLFLTSLSLLGVDDPPTQKKENSITLSLS